MDERIEYKRSGHVLLGCKERASLKVPKKKDLVAKPQRDCSISLHRQLQILVHGTLHVTIFEANALSKSQEASALSKSCLQLVSPCLVGTPETPTITSRLMKRFSWIKRVAFCRPKVVESIEESVMGRKDANKLYATIDLEKARLGRTRMITENETSNPGWRETFHIYCAHTAADVIFTVKANDPVGATLIGRAYLPIAEILSGQDVESWLQVCDEHRNPLPQGTQIHVKVQFLDISRDDQWGMGLQSRSFSGVPYTYFRQWEGCKVTLYQDSHVLDGFAPKIPLAGGKYYAPQRCWEDIFDAISNARHLIYITGWSVYTEITLVRDTRRRKPGGDATLGELLKKKADEGVRVLLLVWDDRTSVPLLKKDGLMATHDQETADYFSGTGVHCVLCPRNPDDGGSVVQDLQISTMFTHHQKTVMVDAGMDYANSRKIVSFVGGIDLCDGRYDTQVHSLFRTLGTTHSADFHQPNFEGSSIKKGGPREPWHDIHCRLEGPVAWNVIDNFEQRWRKQSGGKDGLLLPLEEMTDNGIIIGRSPAVRSDDKDAWNVQLFRSIDGGAASGFPDNPEEAARVGLVSGKDHIIDRSIQDAYINAIRRAKNFIYIENQYFLGSSYGWKDDKVEDIGALHLIPKELSLKIVSKIEAGERFSVYVVVPMWPEGIPESASVQAILYWQRKTMEMMYTDIAEALLAKGLDVANLEDYLVFFCLGNREVLSKDGDGYTPEEHPEPDTDYARAQQARRFMIYVHAKMMIVDDEYIIIGSANINQRSMDGGRDSEIAMGAYQPAQRNSGKTAARGQIHGFRSALWYEHLGMQDKTFLQPESLACIRNVKRIAEKNWGLYVGETMEQDLPGHLLKYPIMVGKDAQIQPLPGMQFFPDTKAPVLGTKSDYLPSILTT